MALRPLLALGCFALALTTAAPVRRVRTLDLGAEEPGVITSSSGATLYPAQTAFADASLYFPFSSTAAADAGAALVLMLPTGVVAAGSPTPTCSLDGAALPDVSLTGGEGLIVTLASALNTGDHVLLCTGLTTGNDATTAEQGSASLKTPDSSVISSGAVSVSPLFSAASVVGSQLTVALSQAESDLRLNTATTVSLRLRATAPVALAKDDTVTLRLPSAGWTASAATVCTLTVDGGDSLAAALVATTIAGSAPVLTVTMPAPSSRSAAPGASASLACGPVTSPSESATEQSVRVTFAAPPATGLDLLTTFDGAALVADINPPDTGASTVNVITQVITINVLSLMNAQERMDFVDAYIDALGPLVTDHSDVFMIKQEVVGGSLKVTMGVLPELLFYTLALTKVTTLTLSIPNIIHALLGVAGSAGIPSFLVRSNAKKTYS